MQSRTPPIKEAQSQNRHHKQEELQSACAPVWSNAKYLFDEIHSGHLCLLYVQKPKMSALVQSKRRAVTGLWPYNLQ